MWFFCYLCCRGSALSNIFGLGRFGRDVDFDDYKNFSRSPSYIMLISQNVQRKTDSYNRISFMQSDSFVGTGKTGKTGKFRIILHIPVFHRGRESIFYRSILSCVLHCVFMQCYVFRVYCCYFLYCFRCVQRFYSCVLCICVTYIIKQSFSESALRVCSTICTVL